MIFYTSKHRIYFNSPAKLNLFLEIHSRRDDGFHELETIMSTFSLYDQLVFDSRPDNNIEIELCSCDRELCDAIPTGDSNLVVKALKAMRKVAGHSYGAAIKIFKNIPVQAGMGGASGNAAAALLAGNRIWNLNWPIERLVEIGRSIGSDVPFFLGNGLSRCTGKGDHIQNLHYPCRLNVVVARPEFGMSTKEIYDRCRIPRQPITSKAILSALKSGRISRIGEALFNRLEFVAADVYDGIVGLRREFEKTNCVGHQLTGSGSCYFGIYRNRATMSAAARFLAARLPEVQFFTGQTLSSRNHYLEH